MVSSIQNLSQALPLKAAQQTDKWVRQKGTSGLKQMEDEPVIIDENSDRTLLPHSFRTPDKKLNISNSSFKFKSEEDWKSLFTPTQRAQRQQRIKEAANVHLALRSIESQSKYTTKAFEYRNRERQKQINPPMKYTSKKLSTVMTGLPDIQKAKMNSANPENPNKSIGNISRASYDSDGRDSDVGNYSDIDLLSAYNYFSSHRKRNHQKTELQRIQEQELKALAHKKLYFKSLRQAQQRLKAGKDKRQIQKILKKCHIVKEIEGNTNANEEVDHFNEIIDK